MTTELLQELAEKSCPTCGEPSELATCEDCGAEAEIINCGHYAQPQPIAASQYQGSGWVCEACERIRDAEHPVSS